MKSNIKFHSVCDKIDVPVAIIKTYFINDRYAYTKVPLSFYFNISTSRLLPLFIVVKEKRNNLTQRRVLETKKVAYHRQLKLLYDLQ